MKKGTLTDVGVLLAVFAVAILVASLVIANRGDAPASSKAETPASTKFGSVLTSVPDSTAAPTIKYDKTLTWQLVDSNGNVYSTYPPAPTQNPATRPTSASSSGSVSDGADSFQYTPPPRS